MNRLPFLDWTRGLAVLIMIQCHTFNSFTRLDLRQGGPYVLSQFVGGMAAVLFLVLAGITLAFQMDKLDRIGAPAKRKVAIMLRRAGYMLLLAYAFRINNSMLSLSSAGWRLFLKVDILNCMGAGMALLSAAVLLKPHVRIRATALAGLAIACASPVLSSLDWTGVPQVVHDYIVPNRASFALFPWSSYLAFGVAVGTILRQIAAESLERTLQWGVLAGFGLVFGGQYFSNLPYSLYRKSEFWIDSPALIIIRVGLVLLTLAGAYLWTEHVAGRRWSWVQTLGKTSLLVYWVHVLIVYGWFTGAWRKALDTTQAAAATVLIMALMLLLSVVRLRWAARSRSAAPAPVAVEASVS